MAILASITQRFYYYFVSNIYDLASFKWNFQFCQLIIISLASFCIYHLYISQKRELERKREIPHFKNEKEIYENLNWINKIIRWACINPVHKRPFCVEQWLQRINENLQLQQNEYEVFVKGFREGTICPWIEKIEETESENLLHQLKVTVGTSDFGLLIDVTEKIPETSLSSYVLIFNKFRNEYLVTFERDVNDVIKVVMTSSGHKQTSDLRMKSLNQSQKIISTIPEVISNHVFEALLQAQFSFCIVEHETDDVVDEDDSLRSFYDVRDDDVINNFSVSDTSDEVSFEERKMLIKVVAMKSSMTSSTREFYLSVNGSEKQKIYEVGDVIEVTLPMTSQYLCVESIKDSAIISSRQIDLMTFNDTVDVILDCDVITLQQVESVSDDVSDVTSEMTEVRTFLKSPGTSPGLKEIRISEKPVSASFIEDVEKQKMSGSLKKIQIVVCSEERSAAELFDHATDDVTSLTKDDVINKSSSAAKQLDDVTKVADDVAKLADDVTKIADDVTKAVDDVTKVADDVTTTLSSNKLEVPGFNEIRRTQSLHISTDDVTSIKKTKKKRKGLGRVLSFGRKSKATDEVITGSEDVGVKRKHHGSFRRLFRNINK